VVIVSMATSSGDYLSRAKRLAILVASPQLLDVECKTTEQMRLVNTLGWVEEYSRRGAAA
jgi:uncharacterized protein